MDIEQHDALIDYLRRAGRINAGEDVACRTLAGGVSNRTVLVERRGGEAWVIKQALAKLRVQADWYSDPVRIHREAEGLRWLNELIPGHVPAFVFEDHEHHLLAMQVVPRPHENWKAMLLAGRLHDEHVSQFARLLGRIHREASAHRQAVVAAFGDRRFFESLRLEPYYAYAAEQVGPASDAAAFLHALIADTRTRLLTLVHGDYSPKNILVHAGRLMLLDHEVIHFGDPAFDLGFALTHLLSKAHHLPTHRDAFADAAVLFWHEYLGEVGEVGWGGKLEIMAVRHTLACMLARVVGRSPLEYLTPTERHRQQKAVIGMMGRAPVTLDELVASLQRGFSESEKNSEAS